MNQQRYKKSEGLKDTYYIGKGYEYQTHTNGSETHKYMIYANGKVVTVHSEVTEVNSLGEKLTTHETRYLHYDSLGSVDAITNQQGTVVQRTAYKPFGEAIEIEKLGKEKQITNRGYTGHEHIEGTKFIHMNARLYDPTIGRFLSADTYIQDPYDSQSYNRYSYVRNNPLRYTDPTGHFFSGLRHWISNNWRTIVTVVVVAVVTVVTTGSGTLAIAGLGWSPVAVGAAAGFAGGFTSAILNGASFGQSLRAGVIGGLVGAVTAGFAKGIGDAGAWMGDAYDSAGANLATRTVLHGALSSFMSHAQGGKWSAGFWSGAVGTYLGSAINGKNYYGNVAKNAIIGGSISRITGGKFSNGAALGAFRYMFNEALHKTHEEIMKMQYKHWKGGYKAYLANQKRIATDKMIEKYYPYAKGLMMSHEQAEYYQNRLSQYNLTHPLKVDGISAGDAAGLALSVGAATFEGPVAVAMGLGAIGIDIYQGDNMGFAIGSGALAADTLSNNPKVTKGALGVDILYGISQLF